MVYSTHQSLVHYLGSFLTSKELKESSVSPNFESVDLRIFDHHELNMISPVSGIWKNVIVLNPGGPSQELKIESVFPFLRYNALDSM